MPGRPRPRAHRKTTLSRRSAVGRLLRFDLRFSNGRIQRAGGHRCAVEGRETDPTAAARRNHGRRYPTGVRAYILASRRRASWIEARVTKVVRVSARFSKSLASRRLRPNQEKVRSTTQGRGSTTKPFTSSLRLTISRCSGGTFATAASTCHAL